MTQGFPIILICQIQRSYSLPLVTFRPQDPHSVETTYPETTPYGNPQTEGTSDLLNPEIFKFAEFSMNPIHLE